MNDQIVPGFEEGIMALAIPAMEKAGKLIASDDKRAQALLCLSVFAGLLRNVMGDEEILTYVRQALLGAKAGISGDQATANRYISALAEQIESNKRSKS